MSLAGSTVACCGIVVGVELVGAVAAGGRSGGAGCAGVIPVSMRGTLVGTAASVRGGVVDVGRVGVVVTVPFVVADWPGGVDGAEDGADEGVELGADVAGGRVGVVAGVDGVPVVGGGVFPGRPS